ncbi:serine/threonine-protein phosphatase 2A regulatory subunit B'' subunit beta isoform X1 [Tribolium castaneum]|uniref:Serine/threonine-protein phosphatase 2A regulatory subunit B'' subunit alpha-like Protein n=1 Tax=Tribolium castaneum TaxID=7070 RepID=D6WJN3_TRICA|nr:PREDICTED: serine/threonine-protein phosphatase 2A regulatory subunit B'' subunit beta isoform X1 [Tribolium castaneum]XP_015835857.1 PREDICTED: serine/threonine-protein phosphatase 2A regulatory subunit B'' subunit beta isoform X1 [Tribolium castaneum]XP_969710.2 PREDICTED: serine/threonine-protein phosphatase 2A regulatory subunit B'' subunit beta isoform X1 [Tribolium castaneum]EFA03124.1 Serine/threonine-protein phosphatase 2A regulatory subunit B'' subunit alpha-like Protein [Tribolium c|eukprot:XP_008194089.1 PREDICTED: serine/threonine-protein phosphatase 2A regulatory subunit B'' subunit beta isoform X1 [Tribolium castaneum]
MATTARRRDPDDDIAAIAKQISEQAEAIYQNWKSRGLAPADLITCHAVGDTTKLGSMLKPQPPAKPSIELLAQAPTMDNNRLEKLVKNFVVEDKARLAARNKAMPSSIQYALQKFEKNTQNDSSVQKSPLKSNSFGPEGAKAPPTESPKPVISQKPQISPKPRFAETIEMTLPEEVNLQTWPLKNRIIKKTAPEGRPDPIDQVALEEKRLINALKNGVLDNELPQNPSLTRNKDVEKEVTTKWGLRNTRRVEQQVPHPELTVVQRQHLRQTNTNPIRPFLTRGSVAERVLIFERCPSDLLLDKRARAPVTQLAKPQTAPKQPTLQHTTLQRHIRAHRNVNIPRFHFPTGKPGPPGHLDTIKSKLTSTFSSIGGRASREDFSTIATTCQLPLYWKTPLYLAACADKGSCTQEQFMTFWTNMTNNSHDAASRFVYILTRGRRNWLAPEDFIPLVQDVVETHPGLTFLKEATEFHSRYVHTVIARIYYCVNRSWSGRITIPELRRSNLLNVIQFLEEEEDINQITQYFSYEHFYVIYCKFWELDRDHDLFIDKQDLTRHNDHALSSRIIDRIFSGCVTRGQKRSQHDEKMSYTEFVWFLLSEEDKQHPTAIEYWFRCMDIDGDGYLSMYELEYFYEEQMQRMEAIGIETLPFQDCLCQMLDMVKPKIPGKIALSDLKKCKMTPIFFDTFFNLEKYLDHEQRDPFASQRDHDIDGQEMSDWDRYAAEEYELLVAEEGGNDQQDSLSFDEGGDEDVLSPNLELVLDGEEPEELSTDSDECSI